MEQVESILRQVSGTLSRLLDPLLVWLARLDFVVRQQLGAWGVPGNMQGIAITAAWVVILFMLVRVLSGWLRLLALVLIAVVVARVYGLLPDG